MNRRAIMISTLAAAAMATAGHAMDTFRPVMEKKYTKPTGQQRLMHAIMLTKVAYHNTTKGKRIPKAPTNRQRMKIINTILRKRAA